MSNKVQIVLLECDTLNQFMDQITDVISVQRAKKIERLRNERDRVMSVGVELALLACLKRCGLPIQQPVYYYEKSGKPQLKANGWYISLSHAGNLSVCAISTVPVGVDIETPRKIKDTLARIILSENEKISAFSESELLEKWVIKESYLKLTGEGINSKTSMSALTAVDGIIYKENTKIAYYNTFYGSDDKYFISCCSSCPNNCEIAIYKPESIIKILNK